MKRYKRLTSIDGIRVVEVIEITSVVGDGTDGNPVRQVIEYYSMGGIRLARHTYDDNLDKTVYEII